MKNGEHDDALPMNSVEDSVREPACEHSTVLAMEFVIRFRIGANGFDGTVHLSKELLPETGTLLVVPPECRKGVGLSFGPDDELDAHPLRKIRARTSAQGDPADGSSSNASQRRSSSSRSLSESSSASGAAAMLSQMASTKRSRSGTGGFNDSGKRFDPCGYFITAGSLMPANDRVERPATMTVPRPDAAHAVPIAAPTRC